MMINIHVFRNRIVQLSEHLQNHHNTKLYILRTKYAILLRAELKLYKLYNK